TAIVERIQDADPAAKVHRRFRYPAQGRLAAYIDLFRDDAGKINGYMVRRVNRHPEMKGIPGRLVSVTHIYSIRFYSHYADIGVDDTASEELTQAKIEMLAGRFETDVTMGLGSTVHHTGLQMPLDLVDVDMGGAQAHRADFRLEVTAANVEC